MAKSKNTLANNMYGVDFEDLVGGEKAAVTRAFKKQPATRRATARTGTGFITATILRIGVNGSQNCGMEKDSTVGDLVTQAGYALDEAKEGIVAQSTGNKVDLNDKIKNGETYAISPEIRSA